MEARDGLDGLDGFEDGVIIDPNDCMFNPESLVGNEFICDRKSVTITTLMTTIVR